MKLTKIFAAVPLAVVLVALGGAVSANPIHGPCADDVKKFCGDVTPGAGGIAACMQQHQADLSEACKTHQATVRAKIDAFTAACGEDIKKHCADVKPGRGAVQMCLHDKEKELSADCQKMTEKRDRAMRKGHGPGPIKK